MEHGQSSKKKQHNKGKGSKLGPKEESPRRKNSKGNASTMGSKVTSLLIVDCQRGTNPRKPMWLIVSPKMCLTSTSQQ